MVKQFYDFIILHISDKFQRLLYLLTEQSMTNLVDFAKNSKKLKIGK